MANVWVLISVFLGVTNFSFAAPRAGCSVNPNGVFPSPDPLLLIPNKTISGALNYKDAYYVPDKKTGLLAFDVGQDIRIVCPGNTVSLTGAAEEIATCVGNNQFQVGSRAATAIDKLNCRSNPTDVAQRKGDRCGFNGTGIEVGYKSNSVFPLYYVCFNETTKETYYVEELVPAELRGYQSGEDRPSFKADDFYDFDVNQMYTYNHQIEAFTELLGSKSLATKYIKDTSNYFLARGHFAARADFIFASHNRASFHFINVGPQWQIFNGGVWNNLEGAVRNYAVNNGVDLYVYTGPFDVLTYPDINNNPVPLYLANSGTDKQSIKVSKFYFKILVEPISKKGVAFIGINDPYVPTPYPADYTLCKDVLSQIKWLSIKDTHLLYACEVQDFAKLNINLPQLDVTSLLTN